jgi:hypothetical protein
VEIFFLIVKDCLSISSRSVHEEKGAHNPFTYNAGAHDGQISAPTITRVENKKSTCSVGRKHGAVSVERGSEVAEYAASLNKRSARQRIGSFIQRETMLSFSVTEKKRSALFQL